MIDALMIDSREPTWVQNLSFNNHPSMVAMLEYGDIMIATDSGVILIERKTSDDFLGSIKDGRIWHQVAGMLEQTRYAYVVITGMLQPGMNGNAVTERGNTGWSWASVQGAILSIQETGCFVVFAANDQDYEQTVLRIANRDRKPNMLLMPVRWPTTLSAGEAVIASLPGIGIERLKIVMDACSTAGWALCHLTDPYADIPGIPKSTKKKIRAALGLADADQMGVLLTEGNDEYLQQIPLGSQ